MNTYRNKKYMQREDKNHGCFMDRMGWEECCLFQPRTENIHGNNIPVSEEVILET